MWNEIENEKTLEKFMHTINSFHDSCLQRFSYISGAYVDSKLSMHPLNDIRSLRLVFQRQFDDLTTFEIEFYGLRHFLFYPTGTEFSCEIDSANMYIKGGFYYLEYPSPWMSEDSGCIIMNSVCASGCRWRSIRVGDAGNFCFIKREVQEKSDESKKNLIKWY